MLSQTTRPSFGRFMLSCVGQAFSLKPTPKSALPVSVAWEWNSQAKRWELVIRLASWLVPNQPNK